MSILKDLKKKQKKDTGCALKSGIILLFDTQKQYDELSTLFPQIDSGILIEGRYCAYMDEYPALQVHPLNEIAEDEDHLLGAFKIMNLKPMDFDSWFRKFK